MSGQIKANDLTDRGKIKSVVISFVGEASPLIFCFYLFIYFLPDCMTCPHTASRQL